MSTPVRSRGKAGNRLLVKLFNFASRDKNSGKPQGKPLSRLELLPNELIQEILWYSLNLNLSTASPTLAHKLNNRGLRRKFIFLAFFRMAWMTHGGEINDSNLVMSYPHCDWPLSIDRHSQYQLQQSILSAPWFGAEVFFSCRREFLFNMVPSILRQCSGPELEISANQWPFVPAFVGTNSPGWFRELFILGPEYQKDLSDAAKSVRSHAKWAIPKNSLFSSGDYRIIPNKQRISGCDVTHRYAWAILQGTSKYLLTLSMPYLEISGIEEEFPSRLFESERWTIQKLDLLLMMRGPEKPFAIHSAETAQALSKSLTQAITQSFLPAVCILSMPFWRTSLSNTYKRQRTIFLFFATPADDNDNNEPIIFSSSSSSITSPTSQNQNWLTNWRKTLSFITHHSSLNNYIPHNPTTKAHLLHAMTILSKSTQPTKPKPKTPLAAAATPTAAEEDAYTIFCWLALSYLLNTINVRDPYPATTIHEIHRRALKGKMTGIVDGKKMDWGMECYRFFVALCDCLECGRSVG